MRKKLYSSYDKSKDAIKNRLNEFTRFFNEPVHWHFDKSLELKKSDKNNNERLFEELSFCLLTANTSAAMSAKAVIFLRPVLENGSLNDLKKQLKKAGYRFPNKRAEYIFEARTKKMDLRQLVLSNDKLKLREYLAETVKGLGYKESSHFLRNIGVFGLSILDKHILRSMQELGTIKEVPKSMTKNKYLALEKKYFQLADDLEINPDELDLLLWSMKSGVLLK